MDDNIQQNWERFLTPEVLRTNLILASVYIAAFEIMKDSIIERTREFYFPRFDENNQIDPKYQCDVLTKNKSVTYASLQWLKDVDAICDEDIMKFNRIKELRNLISHEMSKMLIDGLPPDLPERFNDIVSLLDKVEKWWIINFEIPTNPSLDNKEIDVKEIIPGRIASMSIMLDVALGSDEKAMYYINELKNKQRG